MTPQVPPPRAPLSSEARRTSPAGISASRRRIVVGLAVGVPISAAFLWLAVRNADATAVRRTLEDADAVFFDNPDLPETRSELTLPLRVGEEIIGALDVQSTQPNAFSQEDINILSILADQVSIAIQNARQFEQTRKALNESEVLARQFVQTGWQQFTKNKNLLGIQHTGARSTFLHRRNGKKEQELPDSDLPRSSKRGAHLSIPIRLRGEVIGSVDVRAPDNRPWDEDDLDIVTVIIERAAIAMENARLLAESQKRADKERIIGEISAKISMQSEIDDLLKTAAQELGRAVDVDDRAWEIFTRAARWHDLGKAHPVFRDDLVRNLPEGDPRRDGLWAKSGARRPGSLPGEGPVPRRSFFHHELASALAWLIHRGGEPDADDIARAGDGTELDVPVWARCDVTIAGDTLKVDFSKSDKQRKGFVNCPYALTYADAIGAARTGNLAAARTDADRLRALRDTLTTAKQGYWAEQVEIKRQVLTAWITRGEGRDQEAVRLLRAAADMEERTEKHPVTPGPVIPG